MHYKFDPTRPYGTVWGHPTVAYVQDEHEFDAGKNPIVEGQISNPAPVVDAKTPEVEKFVRKLLSGGPMLMSNAYKESEKAGLSWDEVLKISADIGVFREKDKVKGTETWSLKG